MKLVSTPNLDHQYQVVRADGLPDVPVDPIRERSTEIVIAVLRANLHAGGACRLRMGAE